MSDFQKEQVHFFGNAARKYGDVVHVRFGPANNYLVSHPDGVQYVLQTNNKNYVRQAFGNNLIKIFSGLNLFTSDGDYWLRQRRMSQPAFHRRRIDGFGAIMTDAAHRMLDNWKPAIEQGAFIDMHREMMQLTMEVVGRALFSVDLTGDSKILGKALHTGTDYINYRFNTLFAPPLFIPTRRNREVKKAISDTRRILQEMIDDRRQTGEQKDDLMTMFMEVRDEETGEGMSDEQLRNELTIMIGAGQETTSHALTWTLYLLSQHPEVEAKLLEEYKLVLDGRTPTIDDLRSMPYNLMVLQESMRMYPPAWAISTRTAVADDVILGYRIPKGSGVMMMPYALHHDPRFWDAPERFDPERFNEERSEGRHKFQYIPFGAGPRKCIGYMFALIESQLILATLLQKYNFELKPGYKVEMETNFTLRVAGGLPMRVAPR